MLIFLRNLLFRNIVRVQRLMTVLHSEDADRCRGRSGQKEERGSSSREKETERERQRERGGRKNDINQLNMP